MKRRITSPRDGARRPRILVFVHYYLPGNKSGGPVRSISNLVEFLGDEFDFSIVTTDRDALDEHPYPNVRVDEWVEVGKARVFYASPAKQGLRSAVEILRSVDYDVLYLNSLFAPVSTIRPLLVRFLGLVPRKPLIVAPRGEFSDGAIRLKAYKKRPYMFFARIFNLYRGAVWQASSEHEAADIMRKYGVRARGIMIASARASRREHTQEVRGENAGGIMIASDPPSPATESAVVEPRRAGGPLRIVFLSRIAPMKNLDYALRVLGRVSAKVEFCIYGPVFDEAYWMDCQRLIDILPENVTVLYKGTVSHEKVHSTLCGYDLFFLPTRGENYGHVIQEALAAGLPVLISDQTPWRDLSEKGVGWDLPLNDPSAFVSAIEDQVGLSSEERAAQAERSRAYALEVSYDSDVEEQNRELFRRALGERGPASLT